MLRLVVAAFAAVVLVTGCGSEDDPQANSGGAR
jgi:hypothetical protein